MLWEVVRRDNVDGSDALGAEPPMANVLDPKGPVQATSEDVAQPGGRPEAGERMLGGHPRLDQPPDETVGAQGPTPKRWQYWARVKTPP